MKCKESKHFNTFDQLYEFHKKNQDKKFIITPIINGGYDVEVENIECEFLGAIGGRRFKKTYGGQESKY